MMVSDCFVGSFQRADAGKTASVKISRPPVFVGALRNKGGGGGLDRFIEFAFVNQLALACLAFKISVQPALAHRRL